MALIFVISLFFISGASADEATILCGRGVAYGESRTGGKFCGGAYAFDGFLRGRHAKYLFVEVGAMARFKDNFFGEAKDRGYFVSALPGIKLPIGSFYAKVASGPTATLWNENDSRLGNSVQFTSYVGAGFENADISMGYRQIHISSGSTQNNLGRDYGLLEIGFKL